MYKILISNKVLKEIDDLPDNIFLKIDEVIQDLKTQAHPVGCVKLNDREGYRIRVGSYRLLYRIDENLKVVNIFRVGHRNKVYKKK